MHARVMRCLIQARSNKPLPVRRLYFPTLQRTMPKRGYHEILEALEIMALSVAAGTCVGAGFVVGTLATTIKNASQSTPENKRYASTMEAYKAGFKKGQIAARADAASHAIQEAHSLAAPENKIEEKPYTTAVKSLFS